MSWRRFLVLVRGLSPHSATVTSLASKATIGGKKHRDVRTIDTPKAAESAFQQMFAPPPGKDH